MKDLDKQLFDAAGNGDMEEIKRPIAAGANVNAATRKRQKQYMGDGQKQLEQSREYLSEILGQSLAAMESGEAPPAAPK
ncbi:MAG: hypothetical protein IJS87_01750, partial [Rhodocyclaceae bacterium]|nr:hypothetical protein [Rhodocyclaceae bacterium]